ncbi:MAG: FAD-dependent monooxygenase [Chitinophagales bacterium]|nr:FAD-dependent monooxygenase [Chitinophagales bacterium]MCO5280534.1 FAD-dependent monooxygenase [Chitinophagales bacterium]OJV26766.1 MAG: monooxygenase [Bacteroidetes bacterium 37-13]HRN94682.1 FAD-dependent monooxygenase [Chitinophagales bacterium]HRP40069.1 FAD-dependent monooxygenase [Chitinophagales bacterium]
MQTEDRFTIIGAGIGGLTAALALKQAGLQPLIYESAPEIKPVGAGILLASNAMQVFDKLGVRGKIENAGCKVSKIRITDAKLTTISESELEKFEQQFGVYNVAIHRADLQKILAEEIGFQNIQLSKRLLNIESGNTLKLIFDYGTSVQSDVVIAADGIKSLVRNKVFNTGTLRDSTQRCWRGVCEIELPTNYNQVAIEAWGKGKRFGFVKISEKKIYWYAVINESLMRKASLGELFQEFHEDVLHIISRTPEDKIFYSEIFDLQPITQWQKGKVCLLGDAAHATTPNMGQGACQAIEDAYTLGKLFQEAKSTEDVFAKYEKLRIKKAHFVVNTSWQIGKIAHYENDFAIWFRNFIVKSIPKSINEKQLQKVFDISYV